MTDQRADLRAHLNGTTVRARLNVTDWPEAVQVAGALLLDAGAVEPRYIDAMKATIREFGPYVVIAPGIALPHARPEDGVMRPGLALVTLAPAVEFGHAENDPVDVVVAFAAVDKESHLTALKQLAGILADAAALQRIRAATSHRELLQAISEELSRNAT